MRHVVLAVSLFSFLMQSSAGSPVTVQPPLDLKESFNSFLDHAAAFGFSGTVLVAIDDKVLVNKGYGWADPVRNIPVKAEDAFDIGSITKQFTAAGIMKLEMQGKLKTEDLISKYINGVPPDKAEITLHQTLTHTAGFVNYSGGDYEVAERDETIRRILQTPLTHKPGTRYAYSNSGYSVLAAIIEKVSGQSYENFLNEQLFVPAGMGSTGYILPRFDNAKLPRALGPNGRLATPLDYKWSLGGPYWNLRGNGGILSTTGDMYKWYKALQGEKILSADAKRKLFTPFLDNYAYGWSVEQTPMGLKIAHNGASDTGFNASVGFFPEKRIFGVVLSNAGAYYGSNIYADVVLAKLGRILAGEEFKPLPMLGFINLEQAVLSKLAGVYRLGSGDEFALTMIDGRLAIQPVGHTAIPPLGQFSKIDNPEYAAANRASKTIVEAILKQDYSALETYVADENTFQRFKGILEQRRGAWEKADGPIKSFRIAGTAQTWWTDEPQTATWVTFEHQKGIHRFRFHWKDGKINGIGGAGIAAPITIPLQPMSPSEFMGWHMITARPVKVTFSADGKRLTVTADGRSATATRVD